jgi:hypothetical protein
MSTSRKPLAVALLAGATFLSLSGPSHAGGLRASTKGAYTLEGGAVAKIFKFTNTDPSFSIDNEGSTSFLGSVNDYTITYDGEEEVTLDTLTWPITRTHAGDSFSVAFVFTTGPRDAPNDDDNDFSRVRISGDMYWTYAQDIFPIHDTPFAGSIKVRDVPEPAIWVMSILGLGMTGAALRRRASRPGPLTEATLPI